jgi:hypothetical protein
MPTAWKSSASRASASLRSSVIAAATAGLFAACLSLAVLAAEPPKIKAGHPTEPMFSQPFIDKDEWRDQPVRHRYVHGGFKGTNTLFSIYMPPKELYHGRFFQPVAAVSGDENASQQPFAPNGMVTNENTSIAFAIASGGYLVESNLGSTSMFDSAGLSMYRASAAVAEYSRVVAAEMYGPHRPFGYIYGGSGGGFKTLAAAENTTGIWDGFVPYVFASPVAMPFVFTVQAHAVRLLKDKWQDVVDALDAGGSGNMYATLNKDEADALRETTRMGMPPRVWFAYDRLGYGPLAVLIDASVAMDPTYFDDFWKVPGYLGANPPESLKKAHIKEFRTTISKIVMSDEAAKLGLVLPMASRGANVIPAAFQFANTPSGELKGATLTVKSGGAAGKKLSIASRSGELITVATGNAEAFRVVNSIKTGDEVEIDNSIYLAIQTYHRHQIPDPQFTVWNQFRGPDGKPLYPQRPLHIRPGGAQTGKFEGKMIAVESLVDEYAYPWQVDWYRTQRVEKELGSRVDDQFRVWMVDNAMHSSIGPRGSDRTRIIAYYNVLQQALRDVAAWAETGTPPPANSVYKVVDGQVQIPATAAQRKGVQPVVTLTANGRARTEVKVGQPVRFSGTVEVPPGTGKVVEAQWDFDGSGDFAVPGEVKLSDAAGDRATVTTTYAYSKPGTYFAVLRASSQRQPDNTPHARIPNLARARVVVK